MSAIPAPDFVPRSVSRPGLVAVLAVALALALGVAALGAAARQGPELTGPVSSTPNFFDDQSANYVASQMGQRLLRELPAWRSYAGLQIVRQGIEIDTVGAPPRAMRAVAAAAAISYAGHKIPITYRSVTRSERYLKALTARLMAHRRGWMRSGIDMTSWPIDLATNTVQIGLAHYSAAAARTLRTAYGAGVSVRLGDDRSTPLSGRLDDTAPWYGGDGIYIGSNGCTSWFSLKSNATGIMYNATAGHCGTGTVEVCSGSECTVQGVVSPSYVHWTNGGYTDVELYSVSGGNRGIVWADPTAITREVTSRSTGDPIGTLLCTDGATTREVCRVRIVSVGPHTYAGKTLNGMVYCEQEDGLAAFYPGDSGGPVYAARNGTVEAQVYGMALARGPNGSSGWYSPARYILAAYPNVTYTPYYG